MKIGQFFQKLTYGSMILAAVACPVFTSCYDDSALNERLDKVENDVNQIKSDLAALKAAVENNLSVVDYVQIEGGYELTMSDGSKINIYNGADGAKGDLNYFTMSGGLILGGKAYDGGSLYVGYCGDVKITSGMFMNGQAYHEGGNIYFVGNSADSTYQFHVTGAAIMDGVVMRIGLAVLFGLVLDMKHYGFWLGDALAGFTPFWVGLMFYLTGMWKKEKPK